MSSKILKGLLAAVFFSAAGIACSTPAQAPATAPEKSTPTFKFGAPKKMSPKQMEDMIGAVTEAVGSTYIDPDRASNNNQLTIAALKGILSSLDPHSEYLTKDDYEKMMDSVNGVYGGIGIEYDIDKDKNLIIVNTKEGTPSERAGLKPDDVIIKVDGTPVAGDTPEELTHGISGEEGTTVKLTIKRPGVAKPLEFSIVREIIRTSAIRTTQIGNDIAYIRLEHFMQDDLTAEFEKAVQGINTKMGNTLSSYIIDLRYNGGGKLGDAVNIGADLLNTDKTIVSTRGRRPQDNMELNGTNRHSIVDLTHGKPIVVLVNQGSASASEVLTGALQDLAPNRVTVIGTTTFGKGLVQSMLSLKSPEFADIFEKHGISTRDIPDGIIKLTTSYYFTPSGRSIHNYGVTPNILFIPNVTKKADQPKMEEERSEATLPGGLTRPGDAKADETKTTKSCTPQLDVKVKEGYDRILRTKEGYVQQEILCAEEFLRGTHKWTTIAPYTPPPAKAPAASPAP